MWASLAPRLTRVRKQCGRCVGQMMEVCVPARHACCVDHVRRPARRQCRDERGEGHGEQGTLFVLVRETPVLQRLLEATRGGGSDFDKAQEVLRIAENSSNLSEPRPAFSDKVIGKWRLRWSAQVGLPRALAPAVDPGACWPSLPPFPTSLSRAHVRTLYNFCHVVAP